MGISANLVPMILDTISLHETRGSLMQIGRQDVEVSAEDLTRMLRAAAFEPRTAPSDWSQEGTWITSESFFGALGFDRVESLDVTSAEGATWTLDLNQCAVPPALAHDFDVVFDGGTLEHVFHLPNALACCAQLLRRGGWIFHIGPVNNYVDHGFYQFSPTFWFDWCLANGWIPYESALVRLPSQHRRERGDWEFSPLPPGRLGFGELDAAPYMHWFVARKGPEARADIVPTQAYYAEKGFARTRLTSRLRRFEPFCVSSGRKRTPGRIRSLFHQLGGPFR